MFHLMFITRNTFELMIVYDGTEQLDYLKSFFLRYHIIYEFGSYLSAILINQIFNPLKIVHALYMT